jgi:hypothetical protein
MKPLVITFRVFFFTESDRGGAMDREPPRSAPPPAERRYRLQQWWLDRSVRAKGLIVVAVPLIALAGTAAASELGNLLDSVTAAAHPPIGRLPVHADHATGGALAAGERGGQRMRDI